MLQGAIWSRLFDHKSNFIIRRDVPAHRLVQYINIFLKYDSISFTWIRSSVLCSRHLSLWYSLLIHHRFSLLTRPPFFIGFAKAYRQGKTCITDCKYSWLTFYMSSLKVHEFWYIYLELCPESCANWPFNPIPVLYISTFQLVPRPSKARLNWMQMRSLC